MFEKSSSLFLIAGMASGLASLLLLRRSLVRKKHKITLESANKLIISCCDTFERLAHDSNKNEGQRANYKKVLVHLRAARRINENPNEVTTILEEVDDGDSDFSTSSFVSAFSDEEGWSDDDLFDDVIIVNQTTVRSWLPLTAENLLKLDQQHSNDEPQEFFLEGIEMANQDKVSIRTIRFEEVGCSNKTEYLAKVYCLRQAFECLFAIPQAKKALQKMGRDFGKNVLEKNNTSPEGYITAYNNLIAYMATDPDIMSDLRPRGVIEPSFYDIVFDFFILDAFEDIENPPSVVSSIVNNRWLPRTVAARSLSSVASALITAKINMTSNKNGFMCQLYPLGLHLAPALLGGFLGIDDHMADYCTLLKEEMRGYVNDIFSFQDGKYMSIEKLQIEVLLLAQRRLDNINNQE